jgi:hypothetical protein
MLASFTSFIAHRHRRRHRPQQSECAVWGSLWRAKRDPAKTSARSHWPGWTRHPAVLSGNAPPSSSSSAAAATPPEMCHLSLGGAKLMQVAAAHLDGGRARISQLISARVSGGPMGRPLLVGRPLARPYWASCWPAARRQAYAHLRLHADPLEPLDHIRSSQASRSISR